MRKIILLTVVFIVLASILIKWSLPTAAGTGHSGYPLSPVRSPQTQSRSIRTLSGLQEIRVWLTGSGVSFSFAPNQQALIERLNSLDNSSHDMKVSSNPGGLEAYDIFYSNADGALNIDGSYITIEAVSNAQTQGAGGGNVADIGLRFSEAATLEFGNLVASFQTLGNNGDPASVGKAIDGNTQTFTRLGNTVGESQRLRITIGFLSSSGPVSSLPTVSIEDAEINEGNTGTVDAVFKINLSAPSIVPVTVDYATQDFTAHAPDDYLARSGTLSIPSNTTQVSFIVQIKGDTLYEAAEQFYVNLSNPANATIGRGQGVGTILEDDPGVLTICSTDLPRQIPACQIVGSTINVDRPGLIDDVNLGLSLSYPPDPNRLTTLMVKLRAPDTDIIKDLVIPSFVNRDTYTDLVGYQLGTTCSPGPDCVFDADSDTDIYDGLLPYSGSFRPDRRSDLSGLRRRSLRGDWTLYVGESNQLCGVSVGSFNCWCLRFDLPREGCNLHPARARKRIFSPHYVRAYLTSNGAPVAGQPITFEVRGEHGELRLSEQQTSDGSGTAVLTFFDFAPGENFIEARATVNGVLSIAKSQVTWVADGLARFGGPGLCPMETATAGAPQREATLGTARRLRDNTLAQSPRGQRYTQLYYQLGPEAVQLMMLNPMLVLQSREIIERYKPVIESMSRGEPVNLTRADLDEIDTFLSRFADRGSLQLKQSIQGVREDLRNPAVHAEFHITVTDGLKREVAATDYLRIIKRAGGLAGLIGFCTPLIYCLSGKRRRKSTIHAKRFLCVGLVILLSQAVSGPGMHQPTDRQLITPQQSTQHSDLASGAHASLVNYEQPLSFEPNNDQTDAPLSFRSRGKNYDLLLTSTEAMISLRKRTDQSGSEPARNRLLTAPLISTAPPLTAERQPPPTALALKLSGSNPASRMTGLDEIPIRRNHFIGQDPSRWRAGVPTYARVKREEIYPGIDMVYYGNQHQLEYDFNLAPGADPDAIRLMFDGAESVYIDSNGELVLTTAEGEIRQRLAIVYQEDQGIRRYVAGRYVLRDDHLVGFELGSYDRSRPLVIDPVLAYSTYVGGSGNDEGSAIAVDSSGNSYVIGITDSRDFPASGGQQQEFGGGSQDIFVMKLSAGGQIVYSTYLGGDGQDNGSGVAVDSEGNAYITGYTGSTNFPTRKAIQSTKDGPFNAFVTKLDPAGKLLYSTYLGGKGRDFGSSIAVDSSGRVYVAGVTTSEDFPLVNSVQSSLAGASDVFVATLNPKGDRLVYSTYLGGTDIDGATSLAVDSSGNAYLTGVTASLDFRTSNPLQSSHGGGLFDGFVAKLNPTGTQLLYSTYLGGRGDDRAFRIAVDSAGNAFVTGDTDSANFPVAGAAQSTFGGSSDAFLAKLNSSGRTLIYSTCLGGSGIDGATALTLDSAGGAYVTGFTNSADFQTTDPIQARMGGGSFDAFLAKMSPSGATIEFATYLGGSGTDSAFGVALGPSGEAEVMGITDSTDFPTIGGLQPRNAGGRADLFITRIRFTNLSLTGASIVGKKELVVTGTGFGAGAKILVDGEPQKTLNDDQNPSTRLIAPKAGKQIPQGTTRMIQVRNPSGDVSNSLPFTRP